MSRPIRHLPLRRFACGITTSIRTATTVAGESGRQYVQGEALQRHLGHHSLSVFKAQSGLDSFVLKRASKPFYDLSSRVAAELAGSRRLRLHIDCNPEEGVLVYPYFQATLLGLIQQDSELFFSERRKILRHVGEAIQELHHKDWIHIDVKPDNILVNWDSDEGHVKTITDVALGDFDIAFKSENGEPRQSPYAVGNVMWRSPEGQTGRGVTKASDIFSFRLVCVYALGGGEMLLLNGYEELKKTGISPEQEILVQHFSYFDLVTDGLLKTVGDETWCRALKGAFRIAERAITEEPELKFQHWGQELSLLAQDMILSMTKSDPAARLTIDQVLDHPWWQEAE